METVTREREAASSSARGISVLPRVRETIGERNKNSNPANNNRRDFLIVVCCFSIINEQLTNLEKLSKDLDTGIRIRLQSWIACVQFCNQYIDLVQGTDLNRLKSVDLFGNGKTNDFTGSFDHCFLQLHYFPVIIRYAMLKVNSIRTQEADISLDLSDLGDSFRAYRDLGTLGDLVTDQNNLDVRMIHIFQDGRDTTRDKCSFQLGGEKAGHFYNGCTTACEHKHAVLNETDRLLRDLHLMLLGINTAAVNVHLAEGTR